MANIDIYGLYSNICVAGSSSSGAASNGTLAKAAPISDSNSNAGCSIEYDPCIDTKTATYLNTPAVQSAIHVVPSLVPGGSWVGCSNLVNYSYADLLSSMLPTYAYLLQNFPSGRYLVFSGDVDGIVPFTGTRFWMDSLQFPVTTAFHPWNTPQGQVGGFSQTITSPTGGSLVYATVRNGGHLVPEMQGSRALQLFNTFITGGSP